MGREESKRKSQHQFGREASKYVASQVHSSQTDLEFVISFIDPRVDWVCLDIATGAGHLGLALAPHVREVIATDITREMLDEAEKLANDRKISNFTTNYVDVHQIPYSSNSFDLVASRIAPHHFHDINEAIKEMVRVTKPGGYIFIQDTVAPEDTNAAEVFNRIEKLRDMSHVRDISPEEWMQLLENNNCEIIHNHTKPKDWPLRWWTERMSTPADNVEKILDILEDIYDKYHDVIHIQRAEIYPPSDGEKLDAWSLHPHNGYFLAKKH